MANAEGSDIMLNRVMTKDNIALAALLEIKDSAWEPNPDPRVTGTPLLVATDPGVPVRLPSMSCIEHGCKKFHLKVLKPYVMASLKEIVRAHVIMGATAL